MNHWSLKGKIDDLYHHLCIKYGKAKVWNASNDEVCDLCEGYIKEIIGTLRQKLIKDVKALAEDDDYFDFMLKQTVIDIINRRFGVEVQS